MREQKGSITLYVLLSILFFIFILVGVYVNFINKSTSMQKQIAQIQEEYRYDDNEIDDLYNKIANKLDANADITLAEAVSDKMLNKTTNSTTKDIYGNKIVIPAGFKILVDETTVYDESNISVSQGVVIKDKDGNEFVWVPVGNIKKSETEEITITLGRYSWSGNTATLMQPIEGDDTKSTTSEVEIPVTTNDSWGCTELQPTSTENGNAIARNINDFYTSATTNAGYYIGRFEAGDSSATEERTQTTGASTPGTLVCQRDKYVYNWINQLDASDECRNMYKDGYNTGTFSSDLANSYAWDTAINFIQKLSTEEDAASYARDNKSTGFKLTGANQEEDKPDKYCNIYDLSGNASEFITETFSDDNNPCSIRGGYFTTLENVKYDYACYRNNNNTSCCLQNLSFRPILYVTVNDSDAK